MTWHFKGWENLADDGAPTLRAVFHMPREPMVIMGVEQPVVDMSEFLTASELERIVRGEPVDTPITPDLAVQALKRYAAAEIIHRPL